MTAVPADQPPPLVVWIHGGAWLFGDRRYVPETLRPNQLFDALGGPGKRWRRSVRYLRLHADPLGVDVDRSVSFLRAALLTSGD